MRGLFILLFLFTATICNAQGVVKERLTSWSSTGTTGDVIICAYDSAVVHYPTKNSEGNFRLWNGFVTPEFWESDFDSISYYTCQIDAVKLERTQRIYRNKATGEMIVSSVPAIGDNRSVQKTVYEKGTSIIAQRESWYTSNIQNFTVTGYGKSQWLDGKIVSDSAVQFSPYDTSIAISKYEYKNGMLLTQKHSQYEKFPLQNPAIRIDSFSDGYSHVEKYDLINGVKTNYSLEQKIELAGDNSIINIAISFDGLNLDTTKYYETRHIDSFQNGNLVQQIIFSRNSPIDSFKNSSKLVRTYVNHLFVEQKGFIADSNNELYHILTIQNNYDKNDSIIYQKIYNEISFLGSEKFWTYSKAGNVTSERRTNFGPLNYGHSIKNYYYESYVAKDVNLNFSVLKPLSYPNPFAEKINILFSCVPNKAGQINIINPKGQIIQQHSFRSQNDFYQYEWNSTSFASGIYFAQIIMGKENETIKLMKQ